MGRYHKKKAKKKKSDLKVASGEERRDRKLRARAWANKKRATNKRPQPKKEKE